MNIELALVSKIIGTGKLQDVISKGVRSDLFHDKECQTVFEYLLDYSKKYGKTPSVNVVREEQPDFKWYSVEDPLDWLIDKFIERAKKAFAQEMVVELAKAIDDPERSGAVDELFFESSKRLATLVPSTEVSKFREGMGDRIVEYEKRKAEGDKFGIPLGFPTIDEATSGIQPHEYVTVAAFLSTGKSTFLKQAALNVFLQGKTPLYISLEEEAAAIMRKWDAMLAKLDYKKFKQLDLPESDLEKWREKKAELIGHASDIPVIDSIQHCTVDNVYAEAVRHEPDMIFIDYVGMMSSSRPTGRDSQMWQRLTDITRDLKILARTLKIPLVVAAQTNRTSAKEGADLDNIANSISVGQDSDVVIGMFADQEMKDNKEMELRLLKNRDGKLATIPCRWDHETMDYSELGNPNDRFQTRN